MSENKKAYNNWLCKHCGQVFRTRRLLQAHRKDIDAISIAPIKSYFKCPFCGIERISKNSDKMNHINHCKLNPNRKAYNRQKPSEETRKKVSESMKKAHAEGRAGSFPNRKNCEHSYPEKWLIGVLDRELGLIENKDYETEYYFHKQFLDFAWPQKKLCIEMDGQQHERFEYRKLLDAKKDENLKTDNWKLLRLKWSDVCNNTQKYVQIILDFLKQDGELSLEEMETIKVSLLSRKEKQWLEDENRKKQIAEAKKNGTLTKDGKLSGNKLSFNELNRRKEIILNCGVDLTKFGCLSEIERVTELTRRQIKNAMKYFNIKYHSHG